MAPEGLKQGLTRAKVITLKLSGEQNSTDIKLDRIN